MAPPISKDPLPPFDPPEPTRPNPAGVLSTDLKSLVKELGSLRADVERADTRRKRENGYILAAAGCLAIPILLMLAIAWQQLSIARNARTAAEGAQRAAHRIEDCTTPAGKCYADSSRRTGGAVANILRGNVVIAECRQQRSPDTSVAAQRELETCITDGLKKFGITLPPP